MKIKISTQVIGVLMVALFFVTNVNAFSDKIHKNTIKKKGWHNPFFLLESDISQLKNEIAALQAATNRSEYNSTSLAEKLVKLESDINALQGRINANKFLRGKLENEFFLQCYFKRGYFLRRRPK